MKGLSYLTPEGETITVQDFDNVNKMAYVHISSGQFVWYTEAEYSTWIYSDTTNNVLSNNSQFKTETDAIQEFSTSGVFQHPQEGVGESGGECGGVEQTIKGKRITKESKTKSKEKTVK